MKIVKNIGITLLVLFILVFIYTWFNVNQEDANYISKFDYAPLIG